MSATIREALEHALANPLDDNNDPPPPPFANEVERYHAAERLVKVLSDTGLLNKREAKEWAGRIVWRVRE